MLAQNINGDPKLFNQDSRNVPIFLIASLQDMTLLNQGKMMALIERL